jgi:hypothetical protein
MGVRTQQKTMLRKTRGISKIKGLPGLRRCTMPEVSRPEAEAFSVENVSRFSPAVPKINLSFQAIYATTDPKKVDTVFGRTWYSELIGWKKRKASPLEWGFAFCWVQAPDETGAEKSGLTLSHSKYIT